MLHIKVSPLHGLLELLLRTAKCNMHDVRTSPTQQINYNICNYPLNSFLWFLLHLTQFVLHLSFEFEKCVPSSEWCLFFANLLINPSLHRYWPNFGSQPFLDHSSVPTSTIQHSMMKYTTPAICKFCWRYTVSTVVRIWAQPLFSTSFPWNKHVNCDNFKKGNLVSYNRYSNRGIWFL